MDAKKFFNQHLIFRFSDFLLAVQKEQGSSDAATNNARTLLHYYRRKSGSRSVQHFPLVMTLLYLKQ